MPHLRALARRDGLAARPHLPDEARCGRKGGDDRDLREPLRSLPRLHGLPKRVPIRRAVRQADRSHTRADRTPLSTVARRPALPALDFCPASPPRAAAPAARADVALPALWTRARGPPLGPAEAIAGAAARARSAAP